MIDISAVRYFIDTVSVICAREYLTNNLIINKIKINFAFIVFATVDVFRKIQFFKHKHQFNVLLPVKHATFD